MSPNAFAGIAKRVLVYTCAVACFASGAVSQPGGFAADADRWRYFSVVSPGVSPEALRLLRDAVSSLGSEARMQEDSLVVSSREDVASEIVASFPTAFVSVSAPLPAAKALTGFGDKYFPVVSFASPVVVSHHQALVSTLIDNLRFESALSLHVLSSHKTLGRIIQSALANTANARVESFQSNAELIARVASSSADSILILAIGQRCSMGLVSNRSAALAEALLRVTDLMDMIARGASSDRLGGSPTEFGGGARFFIRCEGERPELLDETQTVTTSPKGPAESPESQGRVTEPKEKLTAQPKEKVSRFPKKLAVDSGKAVFGLRNEAVIDRATPAQETTEKSARAGRAGQIVRPSFERQGIKSEKKMVNEELDKFPEFASSCFEYSQAGVLACSPSLPIAFSGAYTRFSGCECTIENGRSVKKFLGCSTHQVSCLSRSGQSSGCTLVMFALGDEAKCSICGRKAVDDLCPPGSLCRAGRARDLFSRYGYGGFNCVKRSLK